jgi:hypothetical protein
MRHQSPNVTQFLGMLVSREQLAMVLLPAAAVGCWLCLMAADAPAQGCTWSCSPYANCDDEDIQCAGCSSSCPANKVDFDPDNTNPKIAVNSGSKQRTSQGIVVCRTVTHCEARLYIFMYCSYGSCASTGWIYFCTNCRPEGTPEDVTVEDWECSDCADGPLAGLPSRGFSNG